jgi:hypothetical protein
VVADSSQDLEVVDNSWELVVVDNTVVGNTVVDRELLE